jgi:uncharacterized iron-regulated membrane protein
MKIRPAFFQVHRYLGLLAAIPLLLLAATGAILVFEDNLDRALNPSYWYVHPSGSPATPQQMVDAALAARPGDPITTFRLPVDPGVAAEVTLKSGLIETIDPYTLRILGSRRRDQILTSKIHQFHTRLLIGDKGEKITTVGALLLIVLSITGIYLWWNRRSFGIKWHAPWRRVNYDAHYAFGFFGLVPWIVLGATGAAIGLEGTVRPALYKMTKSQPAATPPMHSTRTKGASRISMDAALASAAAALPGAQTAILTLPQNPTGVYLAYMKFPEDHTPAGRSHVALDQYSGRVVGLENSRTAPAGTRLWNINRPIHTGDIFGWPTRILACLFSALLAIQTISGVWMWLPARRAKRSAPMVAPERRPSTENAAH